jgi:hypothetical protein
VEWARGGGGVKFAYADPPYPAMAHFYVDHPDYAGEVDHAELVKRLNGYDGWVLHTASTTLREVWNLCPHARLMPWVKPFASWKKGVYPAYAWEPVLFVPGRNDFGSRQTPRDWFSESITLQRGLTGVKPEAVCWWLFDCLGAREGDELHDLFPGSGAVTAAWHSYWRQRPLDFPTDGLHDEQIALDVG